MATTETKHLVTMVNDIAANLACHADAHVRIAEHINRYWAPRMRKLLLQYADDDGEGLSAISQSALAMINS